MTIWSSTMVARVAMSPRSEAAKKPSTSSRFVPSGSVSVAFSSMVPTPRSSLDQTSMDGAPVAEKGQIE
jgi:hypothetical protein